MNNQPVLIVGAGPVGLTLALTLSLNKVPVRLIDKESNANLLSKALGLHARTLEMFENLGLIDAVLKRCKKMETIRVYVNNKLTVQISTKALQSPYPFVAMLPQNETEEILTKALNNQGVSVERDTELIATKQYSDHVQCTIKKPGKDNEIFKTPWVGGCDGPGSIVRKNIGACFQGFTYNATFCFLDSVIKWDYPNDSMNVFMTGDKNAMFFPMKEEGRYRIMSRIEDHKEYTAEDYENFVNSIVGGKVNFLNSYWFSIFKVQHRIANKYRKKRMFIVGDAAHIHSPAGAQGLNTGAQDAYNLGWKLAAVYNGQADTKILASYSRERRPIGRSVLKTTDRLTNIGILMKRGLAARTFLMKVMNKLELLKRMIFHTMSGIGVNYRKSSYVATEFQSPFWGLKIRPGDRFFDGFIIDNKTKEEKRLFDLLTIRKHSIFIMCTDKSFVHGREAKDEISHNWNKYADVHLIVKSAEEVPSECYMDKRDRIVKYYRRGSLVVVTVRPDGYIGAIDKEYSPSQIEHYFCKRLGYYK